MDGKPGNVLKCGAECGERRRASLICSRAAAETKHSQDGAMPLPSRSGDGPGGRNRALPMETSLRIRQQLQPDGLFAGNLSIIQSCDQ